MSKRLASDLRRKQIVTKATTLFARYGFDRMTVKMLAKACGITEPALYRHFASKEKLYDEVLKSLESKVLLDDLKRQLAKIDDVEVLLFAVAKHIFDTYLGHKELSRLLLYSSLERHTMSGRVFAMVRAPYIKILGEALARLIKQRQIRKVNPIITARCFVGMVMDCTMGQSLWNRMQGKKFTPDIVMDNNIPIFARGLMIPSDKK
ncbi:MAG: TetR/AcrR family transcriptional regulator [candidate division Zixibacteria bacterium]|nr:TetR/AcrR family transcriptional regulator [candidate division Zixibacteria bacterium]